MKTKKLALIAFACLIVSALALTACSGGSQSSSASSNASAGSATSATSTSASASSAASTASNSTSTSPSASSSASPDASSSAASPSATAPQANTAGKQLATGTVVCTTYKDRAAEVGYGGSDFANDSDLLTLLVLDSPITVTGYKGGGDYTGSVSAIRLPNDEMFRQFKDKQITIGVDKWGEFPADVTGMLYDITVDFDQDGLTLVEPTA